MHSLAPCEQPCMQDDLPGVGVVSWKLTASESSVQHEKNGISEEHSELLRAKAPDLLRTLRSNVA